MKILNKNQGKIAKKQVQNQQENKFWTREQFSTMEIFSYDPQGSGGIDGHYFHAFVRKTKLDTALKQNMP